MQKLSAWLNQNLLTLFAGFLLLFIPLYPKWPLFDILPGYNVRIRLEDILILGINLYFFIRVLRKKINLKQSFLFKPILIYLLIGFLSVLSAIFITKTINPEYLQIAKVYLHWLRRIEYFSLFFIFFFSLKSKKQIQFFLILIGLAIFGVTIYGFGQKYLYWPAYSTMNREFSKGIALYLTEHARVLSTFGGHFDLAAYIMMTLIPAILLIFLHPKLIWRVIVSILVLMEYWLLILTASRTSWIAFMVGISLAFLLLLKKHSRFWVFSRWFVVVALSTLIMVSFGDLSERFSQIFKLQGIKEIVLRPFRAPPKNGIALNENLTPEQQLSLVATNTDIPPTPTKSSVVTKPSDVYDDTYDKITAYLATGSGEKFVANYSDNALKYGLSAGIRLDTLWPNALKAFKQNPLLGTGYSTLVKAKVWEFTVAESTDNDFLRMLGETGLLGFLSFMAILLIIVRQLWRAFLQDKQPLYYGLFASGIAITFGLLANAVYIDVFESSKVAYSYWSIIGLLLALAALRKHEKKAD
ncbi:MAG: O-antigen ligase family protein [Candidatus Beckwithbacteria bacterium]|nr:O-antigen ligase family protein [Candidatus Beckwithbacteria bacterium]